MRQKRDVKDGQHMIRTLDQGCWAAAQDKAAGLHQPWKRSVPPLSGRGYTQPEHQPLNPRKVGKTALKKVNKPLGQHWPFPWTPVHFRALFRRKVWRFKMDPWREPKPRARQFNSLQPPWAQSLQTKLPSLDGHHQRVLPPAPIGTSKGRLSTMCLQTAACLLSNAFMPWRADTIAQACWWGRHISRLLLERRHFVCSVFQSSLSRSTTVHGHDVCTSCQGGPAVQTRELAKPETFPHKKCNSEISHSPCDEDPKNASA